MLQLAMHQLQGYYKPVLCWIIISTSESLFYKYLIKIAVYVTFYIKETLSTCQPFVILYSLLNQYQNI